MNAFKVVISTKTFHILINGKSLSGDLAAVFHNVRVECLPNVGKCGFDSPNGYIIGCGDIESCPVVSFSPEVSAQIIGKGAIV